MCGSLLASMDNALAMEVTTDDADDQAGRGESHEQMEGRGMAHLTTCVVNTIFFCFDLFVSSVLFFSLSWISKGGFILILFRCVFLLFFCLISRVFWSSPL